MKKKRESLGKGLDALMSDLVTGDAFDEGTWVETKASKHSIKELPVEFLERGEYQPRRNFDSVALTELSDSIASQGVMQPIIVREIASNRYEIIAGERRWRAAKMAGLDRVPVIVKEVDDKVAAVMALIENLQREDLSTMEQALGISKLVSDHSLTHDQAAKILGINRTTLRTKLKKYSIK